VLKCCYLTEFGRQKIVFQRELTKDFFYTCTFFFLQIVKSNHKYLNEIFLLLISNYKWSNQNNMKMKHQQKEKIITRFR